MNVALIILFFLILFGWQWPKLWKNGQKRELFLYLALMLLNLGLSLSLAFRVKIPPLSDGVIVLFKPLKEFVYQLLKS